MLIKKNLLICMVLLPVVLQTGCKDANKPAEADHCPAAKKGTARIPNNTILHLGHSANLIKINNSVLVFYYPFGSEASTDTLYQLDPNELKDENVYVFASHGHGDHFNSKILFVEGPNPPHQVHTFFRHNATS